MTAQRGETIIPGIAPTPRHPKEKMTRREFLPILAVALGAIATAGTGAAIVTNSQIRELLGLSKAPITGDVNASLATATSTPLPLTVTATPFSSPASMDTPTVVFATPGTPLTPGATIVRPITSTPEPTPTPTETPKPTATATVPAKPTLTAQERAEQLADSITISFPDAQKRADVRNALIYVLLHAPYGATAAEMNQTSMSLDKGDYLQFFQNEWGAKYPEIDFSYVIDSSFPKTPAELFTYLTKIEEAGPGSSAYNVMKKYNVPMQVSSDGWTSSIQILDSTNIREYPSIHSGLFKEMMWGKIKFRLYELQLQKKPRPSNAALDAMAPDFNDMAEELSLFEEAYFAQLDGQTDLAGWWIDKAKEGSLYHKK